MAKTGAEVLMPGHGVPVFGAMRVRQVLRHGRISAESYDQTIALMNAGASLDDDHSSGRATGGLAEKPYLQAGI